MMKRIQNRTRRMAAVLAGVTAAGVLAFAAPAVPAKAAAAYPTRFTQTVSWEQTILPALLRNTDAGMVARQIENAFRYRVMTEGDVVDLYHAYGAQIPVQALAKLQADGYITGYTVKNITGEPLVWTDLATVFDPAYYYASAAPLMAGAGIILDPADTDALFQNFLQYGMPLGLRASANFDPAYYKTQYPELTKALGDDNTMYYVHYLLYGRYQGLSGTAASVQ